MNELTSCDFCHATIAPSDLDDGRALILFPRKYCRFCMGEALRREKLRRTPRAVEYPRQEISLPLPPPVTVSMTAPKALPPPAPPMPTLATITTLVPKTRRLRAGEHGCGLYGSEEERRAQIGPFLSEGLKSREKVLYFVHAPSPEKILGDFRAVGLPIQSYLDSRQLEIMPALKIVGAPDQFDPDRMIGRLGQAADRAMQDGWTGIRIACDMTWALSSLIDSERLLGYENRLSNFFVRGKCVVLCQYNIYRFEDSSLHRIRKCHPIVLAKGTAKEVLGSVALRG